MSDTEIDHSNSEVIRIAARGDGVTRDGQHIPMAAPGDRLDPAGGLIWGQHHQTPPCPHFDECGGCDLQHLDDETLADFVRDRVVGALAGKDVIPSEVRPVHLSPRASRRRATLAFQRDKSRLTMGFHSSGSHRIVDVKQCLIVTSRLHDIILALRGLLKSWPQKRMSGAVELTEVNQGIDLLISGLTLDNLAAHEALNDFAQSHKLARLAVDQGYGPETLWEPDPVTISFARLPVNFPHRAFLQPTIDGELALVKAAKEAVGEAQLVADLFSGIGTFAFHLSDKNRKIYAAEAARDSLLALKNAANRAQLQIFAEHRDLFRNPLRPEELNRFDVVVLDPPRAGAQDQVRQLASSEVNRICYISCNPATFARDAKVLCDAGYRLQTIWPVGQFRWSTHVELASLFVR